MSRAARRPRIGVDQWVAQADERSERPAGAPRARSRTSGERLPPRRKLALLTPAIAVPFLPFVSEGNLFNYGLFILIYALLALGLNVVVGFAGPARSRLRRLLRLRRVHLRVPLRHALRQGTLHAPLGRAVVDPGRDRSSARVLGLFLGSSSRRLLGDYLAIVTLFFGQAFVVFTNAADPYGITNGSNGLANVDPLDVLRRYHDQHDPRLLLVPARLRGRRPDRALLPQRVAHGPRVEGLARGSARRGADGDAGQPAEDHGVQLRRGASRGSPAAIFAAAQTGAFPQNFGTQVLILIYAVVILGGTGSLTGMLVGAIVIIASNQVLDSTSPPNVARVLFYAALIADRLLHAAGPGRRLHRRVRRRRPRSASRSTRSSAPSGRAARAGQVTSGGFLDGRDPELGRCSRRTRAGSPSTATC